MKKHHQSQQSTTDPGRRKPYVAPTVESEEILETSALVCGKCTVGPTGGLGCGALPLNS